DSRPMTDRPARLLIVASCFLGAACGSSDQAGRSATTPGALTTSIAATVAVSATATTPPTTVASPTSSPITHGVGGPAASTSSIAGPFLSDFLQCIHDQGLKIFVPGQSYVDIDHQPYPPAVSMAAWQACRSVYDEVPASNGGGAEGAAIIECMARHGWITVGQEEGMDVSTFGPSLQACMKDPST
ncbi:MAG TPA: hypothetical protein VLD86_04120, partial [Ilumatobacteraceae bacterium]|nr:hypothetical protein [Ilumatobacteraceae bacterium]